MSTEHETRRDRPVVVGVDDSEPSLVAVEVAADEARRRNCALEVVHAFVWPLYRVDLEPPPGAPPDAGLRNAADGVVQHAVDRAHQVAPDVLVTGHVIPGRTLDVLVNRSSHAGLVVIADRGLGPVSGLVVGSVAVGLAAHGRCPVLVVRGDAQAQGPVVVGVDGSPANLPAVDHALAAAAAREVPLHVLYARRASTAAADPEVGGADTGTADDTAAVGRRVAAWVSHRRASHPDVPVEPVVVVGDPRQALIDASQHAGLLVVGSRGRGGFTGMLLGSVSQAVLRHAACPVVVVPPPLPTHVASPDPTSSVRD
ncbi:universal stress protein [Cellulomonas sp. ATA003]|uniref:universal stress protein n=1 Tax=Cellulomonas sp. ATA003 TaxID=3073064 RepID=UPI002873D18F|nr:universal stress protein [Cellulomonas sp. ATA003]WNB86955.1 universal stress protein [Cellulomonas sp. ATA003]